MNWIESIAAKHDCDPSEVGVAVSPIENLRMKEWTADKSPVFSGIASTATVDLDKEVVNPRGLDWTYAKRFKAMYPSHDYSHLPIAMLNNVQLKDDGWYFSAAWVRRTKTAEDYYHIAKEMGVMGVSIGFQITEAGRPTEDEIKAYGPHERCIRKGNTLELSPTFMPANPDAIATLKSTGNRLAEDQIGRVERLVKSGRVSRKTFESLVPDAKKQRTIVLLSA